jgi:hypothetical protein
MAVVDGIDVTALTQESLHEAISVVLQDVMLFARSVLENIRYGRPEATEEEVYAAAAAAGCDFIHGLPDGFGTMAGDRGVKLSGGQRKRKLGKLIPVTERPRTYGRDGFPGFRARMTSAPCKGAVGISGHRGRLHNGPRQVPTRTSSAPCRAPLAVQTSANRGRTIPANGKPMHPGDSPSTGSVSFRTKPANFAGYHAGADAVIWRDSCGL